MLGELEDADEADDSQESEGSARLSTGAAHGRQNVEECHVVWNDRHHIDHVLEVLPKLQLSWA